MGNIFHCNILLSCLLTDNEEAPTKKRKRYMPDKRPSEGEGMAGGVGKWHRVGVSQALMHLHEMKPGFVSYGVANGTGPRPHFHHVGDVGRGEVQRDWPKQESGKAWGGGVGPRGSFIQYLRCHSCS